MTSRIGLIAEDDTDIEALKVIVTRLIGRACGFKKRVGNGCSRIRHKAGVWLRELGSEGCSVVIIVHDLDRNPLNNALNDIRQLRTSLEGSCSNSGVHHFICIPVEEIEAWFWSDDEVVRMVGRGEGKAVSNPELLTRPKEALIRLSRGANKKPLYTTNENPKLAEVLRLDVCRAKCPSFAGLATFLQQL